MSDSIQWLPILTELGEDIVGRILDKSPDVKSALLEAQENFRLAENEAQALKKKGHKIDPNAPDVNK